MKIALLAAAAMIATPLMAQTMPPSSSTSPTAPVDSSSTGSTTSTTTTTDTMNSGSMNSGSTMSTPPAASTGAPMTTDSAAPMPMAGGKMPWCRPGQYTGCREHETKKGEGMRKN